MHTRIQIASIVFAAVGLAGVFELVRRRRISERYALLWMGAASLLLVLAVWQGLLTKISHAVGIYYPPNAFFVIAFAFALLLLLHFSIATSRLADQTRVLAQRVALLESELRRRGVEPADSDQATGDETAITGGESAPWTDDETGGESAPRTDRETAAPTGAEPGTRTSGGRAAAGSSGSGRGPRRENTARTRP